MYALHASEYNRRRLGECFRGVSDSGSFSIAVDASRVASNLCASPVGSEVLPTMSRMRPGQLLESSKALSFWMSFSNALSVRREVRQGLESGSKWRHCLRV